MVNTIARLKLKGKPFEILVELDPALELKKSKKITPASVRNVLVVDFIYSDPKKGLKVSEAELKDAFGTSDVYEVAARILEEGEIQLPSEYREREREAKFKQIVDFLTKTAIDPRTSAPYTAERIEAALKQIGASIDNRRPDEQAAELVRKLQKVIPIQLKTVKIKVWVPAAFVGKCYGALAPFKESEEWQADGSLSCICEVPAGMQLEFFDKLNSLTHGAALTQKIENERERT